MAHITNWHAIDTSTKDNHKSKISILKKKQNQLQKNSKIQIYDYWKECKSIFKANAAMVKVKPTEGKQLHAKMTQEKGRNKIKTIYN
jgi:hypothetical protein